MTKRTPITAPDLFVLMEREFRRRKPRECASCELPLPFRVAGAPGAPNWEIVPPRECAHGCAFVMEEIVAQHQALYDLGNGNGNGRGK